MPIYYDSGEPEDLRIPEQLDDDLYSRVMRSKVLTKVDLLPIWREREGVQVLLGLRTREPMKDWWGFGGDQIIHCHPAESLVSQMRTEMGLELQQSRLIYLDSASMRWPTRSQQPSNVGCHTSSWFYAIELSLEEIESVRLNDEYSASKLIRSEYLLAGEYHPILKHMLNRYLERRQIDERTLRSHQRESEKVVINLAQQGVAVQTAERGVRTAGLPILAQLAWEIVDQARVRFTDAEIEAALSPVIEQQMSTPAAIKCLRDHDLSAPADNLSPAQFRATIAAALEFLE